ncbi:MAG TPA: hypothetical protein PL089_04015 [Ignavibacteria bacterium]|nr:hypothetical protein [Ignavibacteria bacterium]
MKKWLTFFTLPQNYEPIRFAYLGSLEESEPTSNSVVSNISN